MPIAPPGHAPVRAARWILVLALGLGLVRFFRLGDWGLWIDEAFTLNDVREMLSGMSTPNYPLGYWFVAGAMKLLGRADELALRLAPSIAGYLAIPLSYFAFRRLIGDYRAAWTALLVAASTWHVYWSQNARFYTFAQDLALIGGALLARGLFGTLGRARPWGMWVFPVGLAAGALGSLAHPSAMLFIGSAIVAPAIAWTCGVRPNEEFPRRALLLVVLGIVGALGAIPWAAEIWQTHEKNKGGGNPIHFILTTGYYVTPWLGAFAIWGTAAALAKRRNFDAWVSLTALVTLVGGFVLSFFARQSAQYVFVLLPWLAALATLPLDAARQREGRWRPVLAGMLMLPALIDQAHYFFWRHGDRERWRDAYQFVWNARGQDDLIVGMSSAVGEFYLAPQNPYPRRPLAVVTLDRYSTHLARQWGRRERPIWYVVLDEWLEEWDEEEREVFRERLEQECVLVTTFLVPHPFRDLTVRIYLQR